MKKVLINHNNGISILQKRIYKQIYETMNYRTFEIGIKLNLNNQYNFLFAFHSLIPPSSGGQEAPEMHGTVR